MAQRVRCRCGKSQRVSGAIGDDYLKHIGWQKVSGSWRCRECVKKRRALLERARKINGRRSDERKKKAAPADPGTKAEK